MKYVAENLKTWVVPPAASTSAAEGTFGGGRAASGTAAGGNDNSCRTEKIKSSAQLINK